MRIAIIVGTRPEIIKMSPIIRCLENSSESYFIIHTGQHYSISMDKIFFEDLRLPLPRYNLSVGSGTHGWQTAQLLEKIEDVLLNENPDIVLVQGDTNSVLAGALSASKLHIKVGHVEAGLRSYDRNMPEELNRVLTDHASDYLFAPTELAENILLGEGIPKERIFVTGNTVVDALIQNMEIADSNFSVMEKLEIKEKEYFLATIHRPENVDNKARLNSILVGFKLIYEAFQLPIVFPVHPRTRKMLTAYNIILPEYIFTTQPIGYLEFLELEAHATLILTDSGGIQEEACILNVPCVTLRDNTERPETVEVGANIIAGTTPLRVQDSVNEMLKRSGSWSNPFGNGHSAEQIIRIINYRKHINTN